MDHPNHSNYPALSDDIGIDSIPDTVVVADSETGRIVRANRAAEELFHCESSELIGRKQTELHPTGKEAAYIEAFQRGLEGERVNRLQNGDPLFIETFDGQTKPVEINVQKIDTSDGVALLGVFREVSDQLERERDLEAKTSRLNTLLDALPVPVAVLDANGTVTRWNATAETTYGYTSSSVIGEQYPLFIEDDEFNQLFDRLSDGEILEGYETTHRTSNGSRIPVELYVRPLSQNGEFAGLIGSAINISDQKQKDKQLDVLHRVLRHNLRNELNVISAWSQQLDPVDAEQEQATAKIKSASDRLVELTEDAKRIRTGLTDISHQSNSIQVSQVGSQLTEDIAEEISVRLQRPEFSNQCLISCRGVQAISELLGNIAEHLEEKSLEVVLEVHESYVMIDVVAPLSALPVGMKPLIDNGEETALRHGSDLTVAKATLTINVVGGAMSIINNDKKPAGTLRIELPRTDD